MSRFQIINRLEDIRLNANWIDLSISRTVDEVGRGVTSDFAGRKYRLIVRERNFSALERTGRTLLGVIALICTLGCALFSDSVRNLFKKKLILRFGILDSDNSIPFRWHQDLILKKFLCVITHLPILDPIADPYVSTELYDAPAIKKWVQENDRSYLNYLPMNVFNIAAGTKRVIKGLIDYRIQQLKDYENRLGCELNNTNVDHSKLMNDSAWKLNNKIMLLLKKSPIEIRELEEIPSFLDYSAHWHYRCAETGRPVLSYWLPRMTDDLLDQDLSLADIIYEKKHINELLTTIPNRMPKKWPQHLPFTGDLLMENLYVTSTIRRQLNAALKELLQYYKPITP